MTPVQFFDVLCICHITLTALCIKGYNQLMVKNINISEMFYVFERWSFNGTV